ncbi:hypothetical protein GIB67_031376 [Kingdonia uniflora]|uniref:Uncharacterized protein n=1 Tax=Kingdonia uniflora TaxID=39325 RepID=A0A7J7MB87_9MAGN|nr:hypothetical protein GIB67_031376 [Kingdonia uniflora]
MGLQRASKKPHVICIPYPVHGLISPMLILAKLLHFKGYHVTFMDNEFNHLRLVKSNGPDPAKGLDAFCFKKILDGLSLSIPDVTQNIPKLCKGMEMNCVNRFRNLIRKLTKSSDAPNVYFIVPDRIMSVTQGGEKGEYASPPLLMFSFGDKEVGLTQGPSTRDVHEFPLAYEIPEDIALNADCFAR